MMTDMAVLPPAAGERVIDCNHGRRHGDQHADFDPENAALLAMNGVVVEHEIVEIVAAEQEASNAYCAEDEHTQRDQHFDQSLWRDGPCGCEAKDQAVEDHCGSGNHAGLEASPGSQFAVVLHIQSK